MDAKEKLKLKTECALHELRTNTKHIEHLLEKLEKDTAEPPASGMRASPLGELEFVVDFVLEGLDPDGDSLSNYIDENEDDEVNSSKG